MEEKKRSFRQKRNQLMHDGFRAQDMITLPSRVGNYVMSHRTE